MIRIIEAAKKIHKIISVWNPLATPWSFAVFFLVIFFLGSSLGGSSSVVLFLCCHLGHLLLKFHVKVTVHYLHSYESKCLAGYYLMNSYQSKHMIYDQRYKTDHKTINRKYAKSSLMDKFQTITDHKKRSYP